MKVSRRLPLHRNKSESCRLRSEIDSVLLLCLILLTFSCLKPFPLSYPEIFSLRNAKGRPFPQKTGAQLTINQKDAISAFPYISMFLAVLDIENRHLGWWLSNFINILCVCNKGFYTYVDDRKPFNEALNINGLQYSSYLHITPDMIINALDEGYYIYVWSDSNIFGDWSPDNKNRHEAHPVLVYGYELEKNNYSVYRFSPGRGLFTCKYDISDFHKAIKMSKPYIIDHRDDYHIAFIRRKDCVEPTEFDALKFVKDFYDYLKAEMCRNSLTEKRYC